MIRKEQIFANYLLQRERPQRKMFSFAGCDVENINGTVLTINLMITCKLKTNLFTFCCWDSTVEMHVSFRPLGRRKKYRETQTLLLQIQNITVKFKIA